MKRRFAYLSPLPPARTGIADYSRELLPHLSRLADVSLFSDQHAEIPGPDLGGLAVLPPEAYAQERWRYDAAIYQMGNSRYHETIGRLLLRYPGIMVLHDYGLHQLWAGQTITAGDPARYVREMAYALGSSGAVWAKDVLAGREPLPHFEVPLNDRFVDSALGVIVHSKYVERLLRARRPQQRIAVVPAPVALDRAPSLRARLGIPDGACLFGSFGVVSHTKQIEAALTAFRRVRAVNPHCYYLIAGEWHAQDVDVPALIERLGLGAEVKHIGYAESLQEFLGWIASVDVVINLRYPTVGETSAVALRGLAAGRAVVVYDHGWYAELPDDACLKLPPLDAEALAAGLRRLVEDPDFRDDLGRQGAAYVRTHHTLQGAAEAYVAFVERILSGKDGDAA